MCGKMKHVPIKLGPLALLLAVSSICLAVLAILSFSTARADLKLAEQYAQTVQTRYVLERQGQMSLETAEPGSEQVFQQDNMRLTVAIDESGEITGWSFEKNWAEDNVISDLWTGD